MNTITARRYAKALFELALQEKQFVAVREGLEQMDRIIRSQTELLDLCRNPTDHLDEKKRVLVSLADQIGSPPFLKRFVDLLTQLLIQKNRLAQLPEITKVFETLVDEAQGLERVRVCVAKGLSKEQETGLKRQLETILLRDVDLIVEADPALIGGMVVYVGSRIYDGSVKGQLRALRRELEK